ncbi:MAG: glycosyltransferase family 4 protein [Armatimonadetes bacterium]|nr:glycosyltransferase family 4 protein [Armatimonadota bacterium]
MRLLLCNENRGFGGAEVHTLQVARGLKARGHEVHLAVRPGSWLAEQAPGAHAVPMTSEVDPLSVVQLRGLIRKHRIEAVHCHATRDLVLAAAARKTLRKAPRLVKSEHTFLGKSRSGLCEWAYGSADRVVCVSHALRDQMLQELGGDPAHFEVVPNGLEVDRVRPGYPAHRRLQEGRWVGVVSSMIEGKGQEDFLRAARALPAGVGLLLAGDGPERPGLERLAVELGLEVWFPGFVPDPLAYLAGLEVVVVPSRRETFSLVCLEAMALARPLVATRTGGIPEVVEDGLTGTLVPPGDPAALGRAVVAYLDSSELAAGHGRQARLRAVERFSVEIMLDMLERIYRP